MISTSKAFGTTLCDHVEAALASAEDKRELKSRRLLAYIVSERAAILRTYMGCSLRLRFLLRFPLYFVGHKKGNSKSSTSNSDV